MQGRQPKLPDAEKLPPKERPDAPDWLSQEALAEWDRVVSEVKDRLIGGDLMVLASYCECYANWRAALRQIRDEGQAINTLQGEKKLHPLANYSLSCLTEMRRMASEFGFTPAGRVRLGKHSTKEDVLDAFLREVG